MSRLVFTLVLTFYSVVTHAENLFTEFSAEKISRHVYVIHGPLEMPNPENKGFMNNPAFIVADNSVIVVDPGSSHDTGVMLLREIKKITNKPVTHVFNTHIHGDHWLGNSAIKQAYPKSIIFADPRMLKKAKDGEAQQWLDLLLNLTAGATANTRIVYPDKTTKESDRLVIDGLHFNIHSIGIGHSDSDIMIEFVEDSLMFTGDIVAYERIIRMTDGGFRDAMLDCDRAISLNLQHYVPGHGQSGNVDIIKLQKKYFHTLYSETEKYYSEGLEDFEMKSQIRDSLKEYQDWTGFDSELGKHISLAILEIEKAEFE